MNDLYTILFVQPLKKLFLRGPSFVGGWSGRPHADICASISNTPSSVWILNPESCLELIETAFRERLVLFETLAHFSLIVFGLYMLAALLRLVFIFAGRAIKFCLGECLFRNCKRTLDRSSVLILMDTDGDVFPVDRAKPPRRRPSVNFKHGRSDGVQRRRGANKWRRGEIESSRRGVGNFLKDSWAWSDLEADTASARDPDKTYV